MALLTTEFFDAQGFFVGPSNIDLSDLNEFEDFEITDDDTDGVGQPSVSRSTV